MEAVDNSHHSRVPPPKVMRNVDPPFPKADGYAGDISHSMRTERALAGKLKEIMKCRKD